MSTRRAKVLYDYEAQDADQLNIRSGEIVDVVGEVTAEGWILARSGNGSEGYIPGSYFETIAGSGPPPTTSGSGPPPRGASGAGGGAGLNLPTTSGGGSTYRASFDGGKQGAEAPFDSSAAYNLCAYLMEWFGVISLFLGGVLAFGYGTMEPPGQTADIPMAFGFLSMFFAAIFALFISIWRDRCSCLCGSPSLGRFLAFFIVSLIAFAAYPIGVFGGLVMFAAAVANMIAHFKDAAPVVTEDNWYTFCTDCVHPCSPFRILAGALLTCINFGIFTAGFLNGQTWAATIVTTTRKLGPVQWGVAEGFGWVISFNMALIILFSAKFCRRKCLEKCTCCAGMMADENMVFLHTMFAIGIAVFSFLHIIANFAAYESSGEYLSYVEIFGVETIFTGFLAFLILTIVYSGSNESIQKALPPLFQRTHILAVLFLIPLLIAHGKGGLNSHFWMWITIPLGVYIGDRVFASMNRQ